MVCYQFMNANREVEGEQCVHLLRIERFNRLHELNCTWASRHRQSLQTETKAKKKNMENFHCSNLKLAQVSGNVFEHEARAQCVVTVSQLLPLVTDLVPLLETSNPHKRNENRCHKYLLGNNNNNRYLPSIRTKKIYRVSFVLYHHRKNCVCVRNVEKLFRTLNPNATI